MSPEQRKRFNEYQNNYRKRKIFCEICNKNITYGRFSHHLTTQSHNLRRELQEYKNTLKV